MELFHWFATSFGSRLGGFDSLFDRIWKPRSTSTARARRNPLDFKPEPLSVYCLMRGETAGPFDALDIAAMLASGMIEDETLARREGETGWRPLVEFC
jgi:uncharacterized protein DUF4339